MPAVALRYEKATKPNSFVFVLPTIAKGSGGMFDVVQIGEGLRENHNLDVYYFVTGNTDFEASKRKLMALSPAMPGHAVLEKLEFVPKCLCATAWKTAYTAAQYPAEQHLYFVQDYESDFHEAGVERTYCEQTYRHGRKMVTLGPWLAEKLNADLAPEPPAENIPFPMVVEPLIERGKRDVLLFYVQPEKKHRGNMLLWEIARTLHEDPLFRDVEFVFFGSKWNLYKDAPFPCQQEGVLTGHSLEQLLSRTRVGVCASFTNISLMPFHLLGYGARVVEVDLPNVRRNIPASVDPWIRMAEPKTETMAAAIKDAWNEPIDEQAAQDVAKVLHATNGWPAVVRRFAELIGK